MSIRQRDLKIPYFYICCVNNKQIHAIMKSVRFTEQVAAIFLVFLTLSVELLEILPASVVTVPLPTEVDGVVLGLSELVLVVGSSDVMEGD